MTNEPQPERVYFGWEDSGSAYVSTFVCSCGEAEEGFSVEAHGCGRPDRERYTCDGCGRVWRARWVGMTFELADDRD